ncbi:hypothetical protein CLV51_1021212 [Chitinophaga niastensis]|uniref:Uncharacterized protein n=1 Tax=Chitinophaga niastensis TaxID=536980 RepID=A0A2P8HQ66_CHINA|nr:hypothetical protein [Chitinophaga niastensis]PSL48345.1 hypothetical protein CLV51_1021212 [Chitinophaga niastensis]
MATWSKNNRACTTLWTTFSLMQQLSTNFDDSGELHIKDLTFYNVLGSADIKKQQANIIADQLDNIFRLGRGATYEKNIDRAAAMTAMNSILIDPEKQLKDLAEVLDNTYIFWGETK